MRESQIWSRKRNAIPKYHGSSLLKRTPATKPKYRQSPSQVRIGCIGRGSIFKELDLTWHKRNPQLLVEDVYWGPSYLNPTDTRKRSVIQQKSISPLRVMDMLSKRVNLMKRKSYRSITCLPTAYKIPTSLTGSKINQHLKDNSILAWEQTLCQ